MQCDEFEARIQLLLDLRKAPEADHQLQWHAQGCCSCREMMTAQTLLFDSLELLDLPEPSSDFAQRVVHEVTASTTRRATPRLALVICALAATVVAAILPSFWANIPRNDNARNSSVQSESFARGHSSSSTTTWWVAQSQSILELYPQEIRQMHRRQFDEFADGLKPITTSFTAAMAALRCTLPVSPPHTRPRARLQPPV